MCFLATLRELLTYICTTELSQQGKLTSDLGCNLIQHLGDSPRNTVLALGQGKEVQKKEANAKRFMSV